MRYGYCHGHGTTHTDQPGSKLGHKSQRPAAIVFSNPLPDIVDAVDHITARTKYKPRYKQKPPSRIKPSSAAMSIDARSASNFSMCVTTNTTNITTRKNTPKPITPCPVLQHEDKPAHWLDFCLLTRTVCQIDPRNSRPTQ